MQLYTLVEKKFSPVMLRAMWPRVGSRRSELSHRELPKVAVFGLARRDTAGCQQAIISTTRPHHGDSDYSPQAPTTYVCPACTSRPFPLSCIAISHSCAHGPLTSAKFSDSSSSHCRKSSSP